MSAEYLSDNLGLTPLFPHYTTSIYFTIYILLVLHHSKKWEQDQRFSPTIWTIAFIMNGFFVSLSLLSTSLYYIQEAKQIIHCFTETINDMEFDFTRSMNESTHGADIGPQCWTFHTIHGLAFLKLIALTCLAILPTINVLLSNFTTVCILLSPVNMLVYMLALPTYTAFFSAYAISRYSDLTWGQRPTLDPQCTVPDKMPKCSRCNQPCAQGMDEYKEQLTIVVGFFKILTLSNK